VSAISIANRVSNELPDPKLSGYRIRGDSRTHGNRTRIEFVTTGVVLAMLQNGIESLGNVSHLLIDEVHERGVEIDYLLTVLHEWLRKSNDDEAIPPPPKIILMSATIDSTKFSEYFSNAPVSESSEQCSLSLSLSLSLHHTHTHTHKHKLAQPMYI
jgi:HrpA-like RNA helicase